MSNPDFCNMVHFAPLTPAWPADLFGGGANINLKNARNHIQSRSYYVCAIYYHECAYIWRSRNALALSAYVYHGLATKVNNVLPVQIRKCMENVTPSCRLIHPYACFLSSMGIINNQ